MAADRVTAQLQGFQQFREALLALPQRLRRRALRNALAAGARVFRNEARRLAPVLQAPVQRRGVLGGGKVVRKPGTLRRAISVRTSKAARRGGDVGVFVNVRPLKPASARSATNPDDPFYWRFVEFGTRFQQGKAFLRGAVKKSAEALARVQATLRPAAEKLNQPRAQV